MTDLVARLQELAGELSSSPTRETDLLFLQLEPEAQKHIRLCAIPHSFDVAVLRVLDPALDAVKGERITWEFRNLPIVAQVPDGLALHDVVRAQLFAQWLRPESRVEFSAISRRLADFYRPQVPDGASALGARQRNYLFHLIGADITEGFREFRKVYEQRREQARFGECEVLVRLLREYVAALGAQELAWLTYYEAEIAIDSRDWQRACGHLEKLLAEDLPDDLRSVALLRLGASLRHLGRFDEARERCLEALQIAEQISDRGAPRRLIHHELGIIARDQGNFDEARSQLEGAISLALLQGDRLDVAIAYNSLGTLLLKQSPADAVKMFEECWKLLDPGSDSVRIAQVLNNLAMANANIGNWQRSEALYRESLQIKRAAADSYGLASTLLNMARVFRAEMKEDEALKALVESANLFEAMHDLGHAAEAHRESARVMLGSQTTARITLHARKAVELFERAGKQDEVNATRREFKLLPGRAFRRWRTLIWGLVAIAALVTALVLIYENRQSLEAII